MVKHCYHIKVLLIQYSPRNIRVFSKLKIQYLQVSKFKLNGHILLLLKSIVGRGSKQASKISSSTRSYMKTHKQNQKS